jgi:branched-chain amino acid transport system substrate-binding protein
MIEIIEIIGTIVIPLIYLNGCIGIVGCMDPNANNYNPDANEDNGFCSYDVVGCTDSEANNYNPDATVDDGSCIYKIGFLNPLTGPIYKFAPGFTAAANIAIDRLNNNHKGTATFELIEVDSGCDGGTVAGTAAKILVDAGVVAVSGAACTSASMAANAVLYAASIPQVSYASTSPDLSDATAYPLFWRVVPSDAQQGVCLANLVYSIGYNIVAVFHMKNDYAERTADSFNTAFKGDAELIGYDENADEDNLASSVNTYLDGSTYHAIVIISYDDDGAVLIKQIRAWNSDIPIFGADGIANDSFYNQFNDNSVLNNVYASRPVSGAVTKETTYFSGECTLNTDCSNSIYTAECYDSVKLIGDAIMSENGETLGDRIQNEGQQYQGASGIITFLDNGDVVGAGYNIMKFTGDSNTCDAYTWNIMDEIAGNDC